jgi:hypothetical protein
MLFTMGVGLLGVIAFVSMVMMIGNVFAKSPYGRIWALIGGASVFFAAVLMALRILFPQVNTPLETAKASKQSTPANSVSVTKETSQAEQPQASNATDGTDAQAPGDDASDLSFLTTVLQYLKDGKSIPPEFLALLPDGGVGYMQAQMKIGAPATKISPALQSQLVSLARSEGRTTTYTNNTYVPTHQPVPTPKPPVTHGGGTTPTPAPPSNNGGGSTPSDPGSTGGQTDPTPTPPPAPTPTPDPTPTPTPQPPAAGTLVSSGLLKSVLGHTKAQVKQYFQYNQSLGETNGTLEFLRGSAIVDVTMSGDTATAVTMQIDRFTPAGKDESYYKDYMIGLAGMSDATPTSSGGGSYTWSGVYSGASSIVLNIDMGANSGTLTARQ